MQTIHKNYKMEITKKIWNWLNGKKTAISAIYFAVLSYSQSKGFIGPDEIYLLSTIGGIMLGIGVGHKIGKVEANKKDD